MRAIRSSRVLPAAVALVALAGCGSSGGDTNASGGASPSGVTVTTPIATATAPIATATAPSTQTNTSTSPENQPGGAGDEVPISSQALFTGKDGEITPATVHVPPFIAVKVLLHSADGGSYKIEVAKHELAVDSGTPTATVTLSGLRAGKRYAVEVAGAPERLSIVANAEPGP